MPVITITGSGGAWFNTPTLEVGTTQVQILPLRHMIGKVITMDSPNANGRIYPREVLEKSFIKYKNEMIDKGRAIVFSKMSNNLDDAYGLVEDYEIKGGSVYIKVKPLLLIWKDCNKFTDLIKNNVLHFTTAGIGTIKNGVVQDDFILDYIFLTDDPSYLIKTEI